MRKYRIRVKWDPDWPLKLNCGDSIYTYDANGERFFIIDVLKDGNTKDFHCLVYEIGQVCHTKEDLLSIVA